MLTADPGREDVYQAVVYLPQEKYESQLRFVDGVALLDPEIGDPWAQRELLKLARVLKKTPRATLTRWRGRS